MSGDITSAGIHVPAMIETSPTTPTLSVPDIANMAFRENLFQP